ncbi:hypothetical protein [Actinoplanes couchii]|nr:hypothetical protein [Actinoplanes couchii]MDR6323463.1 hypothetical protein [Actinoplanes couchii]
MFLSDGSRVEMAHGTRVLPDVRVFRATDTAVTLSLALDDIEMNPGDEVTVRWPAGLRGRYALRGTVAATDENRVHVRFAGQPEIEQLRDYVRGGGGETVQLVIPGAPERYGRVHDISERSVRAFFNGVGFEPGQDTRLRVQLAGDGVVDFPARVLRAATIRQQVPVRGPLLTEVVAIFEQDERQARIIRRYVMRLQLEARRQARSDDSPEPAPTARIIALR